MSYITTTFNHFRAIQRWAAATGGRATLDAVDFSLEVKHRNRYFRLHPMFVALTEGRLSHVATLTDEVIGFAGWLPYRPYDLELAKDKLLFKAAMTNAGLPTPQWWSQPQDATKDFVVKRARGSFGLQISGPYRAGTSHVAEPEGAGQADARVYVEEFIEGQIVKAWFWGGTPFFAHVQTFPTVLGDGATTLAELVERRLKSITAVKARAAATAIATQCLRYQGLGTTDPFPAGQKAWIDFRYGRRYAASQPTATSDGALAGLPTAFLDQLVSAGQAVANLLMPTLKVPVAYAMDGMLSEGKQLHWLELNSNPVLPPDLYGVMFDDLFG